MTTFYHPNQARPALPPPNALYGIHAVEEAVKTRPNSLEKIFFDADKHADTLYGLLKECRRLRIPYHVIPAKKMDFMFPGSNHQGVAALCPVKEYAEWPQVLAAAEQRSPTPLFLVPASVEDTGNLGAIIRSAVAFDVDAILLEQKYTAPVGPGTAKSAAGALEKIDIVKPRNLEAILTSLREKGYGIVGADAAAKSLPGAAVFLKPTVLIVGGEDRGIPPYLKKLCTQVVGIPISQKVQSLNVSVAAGIVLYECAKQRAIRL
jgi:23S rRNA (guanosine2251-2'-O)-methyltransferase